jgi:protein-arginine kinase activator protein McsA
MKCEKCGMKTATSHVVSIVNGRKEEHHFCNDCFDRGSPFGKIIRDIGGYNYDYDDDCDGFNENDELDENGVPHEYSYIGDESMSPFDIIDGIARLAAKEVYFEERLLGDKMEPDIRKSLSEKEKHQKSEPLVICSVCGTTSESVNKTRKAGCAKCYSVFETVLMERYQTFGGKAYRGKTYSSKNANSDVDYLQKELSIAVKNQNFERAAEIRDNIKKLKTDNSKYTKNKRCKRGNVE